MTWAPPEPQPQPTPPPVEGTPLRDSEEIQGNILAGFNKDRRMYVFLRLADGPSGRDWLRALTRRIATTKQVATFNEQFSRARRNRGGDDPEKLRATWVNVSFTAGGLFKLAPNLPFSPGDFAIFLGGPEAAADRLGDAGPSHPSGWVFGRQDQEIDALLTVEADDVDDLRGELDKTRQLAAKHGVTVVFEQRGDTLPGRRAGHEHFGFKDGISQPGIRGFHETQPNAEGGEERKDHPGTKMIAAGEFVIGHRREGNNPEPWLHPEWMRDGSFHVFRRLRQDVPGWWAQVTARSRDLPDDHPMRNADLLAAKLVGRWRSGTPVARAPERDNRSARDRSLDNDFNYAGDDEGLTTPRCAHIRKMYPRDNSRFRDDGRRIIRRGIPFGRPFDPAGGRGNGVDAERGLLFNAYMASIGQQFEFLQQDWANTSTFPSVVFGDNRVDGPDPVIGESPDRVEVRQTGMPDAHLDFRRFVHATGALYAFAPSLPVLKSLADGTI